MLQAAALGVIDRSAQDLGEQGARHSYLS